MTKIEVFRDKQRRLETLQRFIQYVQTPSTYDKLGWALTASASHIGTYGHSTVTVWDTDTLDALLRAAQTRTGIAELTARAIKQAERELQDARIDAEREARDVLKGLGAL